MVKNYRKTLLACYLGFITQAIAANFAPLLFLKFHEDYGIPWGKIAMISGTFFVAQLIVDALCARFADRIGYRKCVIAAEVCSAVGLIGLAFLPELLRAGTRRFVLGHLSRQNNTPELALQTALASLVQAGFVPEVDFLLEAAPVENRAGESIIL